MTYIEFFDPLASENICACLTYAPDRVIYIGGNSKLMNKHIDNYKKVFDGIKRKSIEFSCVTVDKKKLDEVVKLLSEIVIASDDCVFDITGGDEMMLFALGIVYAMHPEKNIQIHKFNLKNNAIYDYDQDGVTIYKDTPTLSIDENIRIYGGEVAYTENIEEEKTYKWDLSHDFLNDINLIWDICKNDVRGWNKQMFMLEAFESVGTKNNGGLTTVASKTAVINHLAKQKTSKNKKIEYTFDNEIISGLLRGKLLTYFHDDEENVTVSYKNKQVKKCLTKAGQALEMKIYTLAKSILDKNGVPVYDDALNGVVIDWDGELHEDSEEKTYDTKNEIDVMLMHDVVPVFISCKNGEVSEEELYKLNTVAERFGGEYSKKVLIATSLYDLGDKGEYIRQRAKDMNIKIIEKVQDMDDSELKKELKNRWSN